MTSKAIEDLSGPITLAAFLDQHVTPLIEGVEDAKLQSLSSLCEDLTAHQEELEKQITLTILRAPQAFKETADEIARNLGALQRLGEVAFLSYLHTAAMLCNVLRFCRLLSKQARCCPSLHNDRVHI